HYHFFRCLTFNAHSGIIDRSSQEILAAFFLLLRVFLFSPSQAFQRHSVCAINPHKRASVQGRTRMKCEEKERLLAEYQRAAEYLEALTTLQQHRDTSPPTVYEPLQERIEEA